MNGGDAKAGLEEEARAYAAEHPEEAPPAPPPPQPAAAETRSSETPPPSSAPQTSTDDDQAEDESSEFALGSVEIAELGVTAIDFGLQNFVSSRCAFKPQQTAVLVKLGAKVVDKYMPDDLAGAVEPEYAFLGALALFAYGNYRSSAPPKGDASPAGGSEAPKDGAGVSTEASVDGKPVDARVLQ